MTIKFTYRGKEYSSNGISDIPDVLGKTTLKEDAFVKIIDTIPQEQLQSLNISEELVSSNIKKHIMNKQTTILQPHPMEQPILKQEVAQDIPPKIKLAQKSNTQIPEAFIKQREEWNRKLQELKEKNAERRMSLGSSPYDEAPKTLSPEEFEIKMRRGFAMQSSQIQTPQQSNIPPQTIKENVGIQEKPIPTDKSIRFTPGEDDGIFSSRESDGINVADDSALRQDIEDIDREFGIAPESTEHSLFDLGAMKEADSFLSEGGVKKPSELDDFDYENNVEIPVKVNEVSITMPKEVVSCLLRRDWGIIFTNSFLDSYGDTIIEVILKSPELRDLFFEFLDKSSNKVLVDYLSDKVEKLLNKWRNS